MIRFRRLSAVFLILCLSIPVYGAERSQSVRREFVQTHECPLTGKIEERCEGYQVDHMEPLCAGGKDSVENLQWLEIEQHKRKSAIDRLRCSVIRKERERRQDQK